MKIMLSQSFSIADEKPIELSKDKTALNTIAPKESATSDCNMWLPHAAKVYNISSSLSDYVLVPVPVLITDYPNTNGDSLSLAELLRFDVKQGRQAFKTFKGKPTYLEHDNQNPVNARGVILDARLRPLQGFANDKHYKLVLLLAFDRTKDPALCREILSQRSNAYSLGFLFNSYSCSYCGKKVAGNDILNVCQHTMPNKKTYELNGRLVYRLCHNATGFETSAVESPAYAIAIQPTFIDVGKYA